jgi:hypothetical protein
VADNPLFQSNLTEVNRTDGGSKFRRLAQNARAIIVAKNRKDPARNLRFDLGETNEDAAQFLRMMAVTNGFRCHLTNCVMDIATTTSSPFMISITRLYKSVGFTRTNTRLCIAGINGRHAFDDVYWCQSTFVTDEMYSRQMLPAKMADIAAAVARFTM